jgi:hypothetical protein
MRVILVLLVLPACAFGPVRRVTVAPMKAYDEVKTIRGEPAPDLRPELAPLDSLLLSGVSAGLQKGGAGTTTTTPGGFRLRVTLLDATEGSAIANRNTVEAAANLLGIASETATRTGRLSFEARLFAPDEERELGYARYEGAGQPAALASRGGVELGEALANKVSLRRHEWFERRILDDRFFLTPTATTMEPGSFAITNDEVLLFRVGWGIHRRVQLNFMLGGFGVPFGGAIAIPAIHVVGAGAGGGIGLVGVVDVGLKFLILDEGRYAPGISASYDMMNVFGAVFGAGALVLGGRGGGAIAAAAGIASVNVQLNVFNVTVAKHFGPVQVTAGTYVFDNHHWLPQNATVTVGVGLAGSNGGAGGMVDSSATPIPRVPTQVQPYAGFEWVLGPHSALMAEFLPRIPFEETMVTTGARWQLGWDEPIGPIARDRIRFRIDVAGIWVYLPKTSSNEALFLPLPWVGLGVLFK